jgi:hypothetical protein
MGGKALSFQHEMVGHSSGEYVRGIVHTNSTGSSFWSRFKRGIVRTYHNVSKKYLPLYLNEFSFRLTTVSKNEDIFGSAISGC